MKRLKSLGVLALVFALLATSALPAFAASNAEFAAADTLYELGLFKGTGVYPDGTPFYALDRAMTRQEAITMFVGLIGKKEEALAGSWTTPFTDVDDWAKPFVGYAYEHGLTAGVGPTLFGATRPVTQVQYLTFVLHALGYEDEIDFVWDKSLGLARQIGIADEAVEEFFRRDAVMASYRALAAHYKNSENCILGDMDGKPADAKLIPMEQKGFLFTWQENGEMVVACYGADKTPKERYRVPAIAGDIKGATLKSYHREGSPTGWGYIYGPEGLYRTVEGKLLQISAKPAADLCFYRAGAGSSGPVILSFDPEKPVLTVLGSLGGDRIMEINEDGSESVYLSAECGHGINITEIHSGSSSISFSSIKAAEGGGFGFYLYVLLRRGDEALGIKPSIAVQSYTADHPENDPDWDPEDPTAYSRKYWVEETQRLNALGLGTE